MPLSPSKKKDRALAFSREWARERAERAEEAQTSRMAFLFELCHKYTSLLPAPEKPEER